MLIVQYRARCTTSTTEGYRVKACRQRLTSTSYIRKGKITSRSLALGDSSLCQHFCNSIGAWHVTVSLPTVSLKNYVCFLFLVEVYRIGQHLEVPFLPRGARCALYVNHPSQASDLNYFERATRGYHLGVFSLF